MVEVTPSRSRPSGRRWREVVPVALRWGLPVLWVLWAGLAWWAEPRESTEAQLNRDLAGGRVVSAQRANGWADDGAYWASRPRSQYASNGGMLTWTLSNGQTRYTFDAPPAPGSYPGGPDPSTGSRQDALLAELTGRWQASNVLADRIGGAAGLLAGVLIVLWLGRLIGGAPPLVGTRWFWFWVGLLPFGVGVLAWSYRELWRPPSPPVLDRGSGWRGVGWLILAGVGISLLVSIARVVFGTTVVPG
ncbi:hypothetical protein LADH09A_005278 [Micromonospora sp. LAH09]|uniref:hypothetical protein n=1 Tax=Micromonospora cabrerizensis TaxID=2911213 RepID=UPI001EE919D9|nr:hypothetical protein [Micromonospora cabrerizensis]MCG5471292.1 hypothetical protein [Micromonospora cabrerizensis]